MVRFLLSGAALSALIACQPIVPDSGFDAQASAQRDAALAQSPTQPGVPAPQPVQSASLDPAAQPLPSSVTAAVSGPGTQVETNTAAAAAAANSGQAPLDASPSNPVPGQVNNPGISSEQDFDSVSSERSIESDAQRIATNRDQYRVIAPTELPTRPGTDQPNIVAYALKANNPVGTQIYRRANIRSAQRHVAACAGYPSPDQAQIEFLSRGGPQRDRKGLDPDGDGYACSWDPTPFRSGRTSAPATALTTTPVTQSSAASATTTATTPPGVAVNPVVQPLVISSE
ncbi:MAG: hypothetical protein ABJL99_18450 [Aliishimia sp.]